MDAQMKNKEPMDESTGKGFIEDVNYNLTKDRDSGFSILEFKVTIDPKGKDFSSLQERIEKNLTDYMKNFPELQIDQIDINYNEKTGKVEVSFVLDDSKSPSILNPEGEELVIEEGVPLSDAHALLEYKLNHSLMEIVFGDLSSLSLELKGKVNPGESVAALSREKVKFLNKILSKYGVSVELEDLDIGKNLDGTFKAKMRLRVGYTGKNDFIEGLKENL